METGKVEEWEKLMATFHEKNQQIKQAQSLVFYHKINSRSGSSGKKL